MKHHSNTSRMLQKFISVINKILLYLVLLISLSIICVGFLSFSNQPGYFQDSVLLNSFLFSKTISDNQIYLRLMQIVKFWWSNFSKGLEKGFIEAIVIIPIFALSLYIIITSLSALQRGFQKLFRRQNVNQNIRRKGKALFFIVAFVIVSLCVLAVISFFKDVPIVFFRFVKYFLYELLISILILAVIILTWRFVVGSITVDDSLDPFAENIINEAEAKELRQIQSLHKWIRKGDETGYFELQEDVSYGNGLSERVLFLVKRELRCRRIQRCLILRKDNDRGYEQQLQFLLGPNVANS